MRALAILPQVKLTVWLTQMGYNYFTEDDLGLYLASYRYIPPETKTEYVSIPGRTGDLDYTEALSGGVVHYGNGNLEMTFKIKDMQRYERGFQIAEFHGKRAEATISEGLLSTRKFVGRLSVESIESAKISGYITLKMNVASLESAGG